MTGGDIPPHHPGISDKALEKVYERMSAQESDDEEPQPNYMHQCGETAYMSDAYQRKEPRWCENCGRTAVFTRIERD